MKIKFIYTNDLVSPFQLDKGRITLGIYAEEEKGEKGGYFINFYEGQDYMPIEVLEKHILEAKKRLTK